MMTCRTCGKRFKEANGLECPHCGEMNNAAKSGVIKSSMILISAGETEAVYRSVREVPAPLRRKLLKSTNGLNSATILIADRKGREQITRAIQNLPSSLQRRFLHPDEGEDVSAVVAWLMRPQVKGAIGAALVTASAAILWLMFAHRWF